MELWYLWNLVRMRQPCMQPVQSRIFPRGFLILILISELYLINFSTSSHLDGCSPCPAVPGYLQPLHSLHTPILLFTPHLSLPLCVETKCNDEQSNCLHAENLLHCKHIPVNWQCQMCMTVKILTLIGCQLFWKYLGLSFGAGNSAHEDRWQLACPSHRECWDFQHLAAGGPSRAGDNNIDSQWWWSEFLRHSHMKVREKKRISLTTCSFFSLSLSISMRTSNTFSPTQDQLLSPPAIWNRHRYIRVSHNDEWRFELQLHW